MAALILDATDDQPEAVPVARRIVQRLDLGAGAEQAVAGLVADAGLLAASARRLDRFDEEAVLQLAVHLGSPEQARALYLLTQTGEDLGPLERERLRQVHELVQAALAHPELTGRESANAVEQRRSAAERLTADPVVRDRIRAAPRSYVLATPPADLARHAALCEPPPRDGEVRVHVEALADGHARVDIVSHDRAGLLAAASYALNEANVDVSEANVATWGDACALASFRTAQPADPPAAQIEEGVVTNLRRPLSAMPLPDATVDFDDEASPWNTICRVRATDRPGLLHAVTTAFAASSTSVHSARAATAGARADDVFELTDRSGRKLSAASEDAIRALIVAGGSLPAHRRWRRRRTRPGRRDGITEPIQESHQVETQA